MARLEKKPIATLSVACAALGLRSFYKYIWYGSMLLGGALPEMQSRLLLPHPTITVPVQLDAYCAN